MGIIYEAVILGNSHQEVIHTVKNLIAFRRNMDLLINKAKTNCMLMAYYTPIKSDLTVGLYTIEQFDDFKYLGVNINHKNDMHNEVKQDKLGESCILLTK